MKRRDGLRHGGYSNLNSVELATEYIYEGGEYLRSERD